MSTPSSSTSTPPPATTQIPVQQQQEEGVTTTTTSTSTNSALHQSSSTTAVLPPVQELDVAFCCDCTASMGSYIKSAQENIRNIAADIHRRTQQGIVAAGASGAGDGDANNDNNTSCEGSTNTKQDVSLRFALVKYRDHPPQDRSFITETFPFTSSLELMKRHVDTMVAQGGGDGPEAVAAALHEVNAGLNWRPNATKVVVLIADAPPHGLGESGDGFPDGCPLGHDPIKICKEMAAKGIVVYAVGVEPVLSTSYKFARDFMMMVADVTDGKFLPLGRASVLTDVVVNGTLEGANMKSLWEGLEQEAEKDAQEAGKKLTKEQLVVETQKRLEAKKDAIVMNQIAVSNPYLDSRYDYSNMRAMEHCSDLKSARAQLSSSANAHVSSESAGYNWAAQSSACVPQQMQQQQQQRMCQQAMKQNHMFHY